MPRVALPSMTCRAFALPARRADPRCRLVRPLASRRPPIRTAKGSVRSCGGVNIPTHPIALMFSCGTVAGAIVHGPPSSAGFGISRVLGFGGSFDTPRIAAVVGQLALPNRVAPSGGFDVEPSAPGGDRPAAGMAPSVAASGLAGAVNHPAAGRSTMSAVYRRSCSGRSSRLAAMSSNRSATRTSAAAVMLCAVIAMDRSSAARARR